LVIPPKPQPVVKPAPHHLAISPAARGPQPSSTPQPAFVVSEEPIDVGDIWTEQERIRLKENWEEEQRKVDRRHRRKEMFRKKLTGIPSASRPVVHGAADVSAAVATPVHTEPKEITLNISMPSVPKVTLPKIRVPALPRISKKRAIAFATITVVLIVGAVGYNIYKGQQDKKAAVADTDNGVTIQHLDAAKQTGKPDYDTVLPAGKTIKDFGGWVRVSPQDKNPVYAYADQINNVLINVSEQPLPATFKADTATAMDDLAASYSANDKVTVGLLTVYIGTSIKGPQSVLFTKGDLLILMKSASKIADKDWSAYIRTLQ
jgi:hypothetical protein